MENSSKPAVQRSPYRVLDVSRKASLSEIKRAYFALVRQYPPEEEPEKFREIREAYELLKSPEKRMTVDMFLLQPPPDLPSFSAGRYDLTVHPEDMLRLALEMRLADISFEHDFREPELRIEN